MKKLMFVAALAVVASGAYAEEAAPATVPADAPKAVEVAKPTRQRPAFTRAKFEEHMKQRREERKAKVLEAIKAAGIADETKAKELVETIDKLYARPMRPMRPMRPSRPVMQGDKPAEQK